ncbi:phosphate acyltransferase [Streptococcus caprae]|uniref:Phosphate acyltransferase n=1 Tax=Streptococcus caprae TaxID=1640501 RepID=A0ABV8CT20_9STRE
MAFTSFTEIESYILSNNIVKTIALACAQDEIALASLVEAKRKGVVKGILIGDLEEIKAILSDLSEPVEDYELIECLDEMEAGRLAVSLVKEGRADIPMKGLMMTSSFMKAILNKEEGFLGQGDLLSQSTVLEYPEQGRMQIIADCAVNIAPDLEEKKKLLKIVSIWPTNWALTNLMSLSCQPLKK